MKVTQLVVVIGDLKLTISSSWQARAASTPLDQLEPKRTQYLGSFGLRSDFPGNEV